MSQQSGDIQLFHLLALAYYLLAAAVVLLAHEGQLFAKWIIFPKKQLSEDTIISFTWSPCLLTCIRVTFTCETGVFFQFKTFKIGISLRFLKTFARCLFFD
ncbi:hypothetical protein [Psychrobacillus psychrodurans]|uniref:hypothetical protein n=1 Tax=Psychrobacillus psychrodurans TaxID=126157 RepID=UPI000B819D4A|nr:hypothetical protein [Psychrobacillus psychrodurans]MCZ8540149.1 hypothetical protein [Psychrobacillus psychrodurans]